jgi:hypothetical protein
MMPEQNRTNKNQKPIENEWNSFCYESATQNVLPSNKTETVKIV